MGNDIRPSIKKIIFAHNNLLGYLRKTVVKKRKQRKKEKAIALVDLEITVFISGLAKLYEGDIKTLLDLRKDYA